MTKGEIIARHGEAVIQYLRSKVRSRHLTSIALLGLGIVLIAYVGGSYGLMYRQQHELMQQWQAQNSQSVSYALTSVGSEDRLTRLSIPKIDLDVVVMEGASGKQLALGPGHLENTAIPGDPGNSVIAAHRDTYFRKLYELRNGDDIYVQRSGRKYHYIVTDKRVVLPTDLSVLDNAGDSRLTLITCYPLHFLGPAPERLIVFAKLVQET